MNPRNTDSPPVLTGRVVNVRTGRPPARLPLAAVRMASLEAADPAAPAPAEWRGASELDGSFTLDLAGASPTTDDIVVFTASPLYTCATLGAALEAGWPTAGALLAVSPQPVQPSAETPITLGVEPAVPVEPRTEMVTMTDGARLATEIFLPGEDGGPWPAVLARTPYGRFWLHDLAASFIARGYAFVAQDMRGRFDSEGEALAFADCGWAGHRDGYTTVEWIAGQPWCDGRVATVGGSALGITQYLLAPAAPPHLVCQVVAVGAPSLYHYAVYTGGLFSKADIEEWLRTNGWPEHNLHTMRAHYMYDAWWRNYDAIAPDRAAAVRVPGLHIGGWFDIFQQGTIDAFLSRQHGGGEGARGRQRLIMGPWTHAIGGTAAGQLSWPPNAALDIVAETIGFVESCIRSQPESQASQQPVLYYLMGSTAEPNAPGNVWRTAEDWPPPSRETPLYLAPDARLSSLPPTQATVYTLRHDPFDPVPSTGGFNLVIPAGPMDQSTVEQRSDVLVFTSEPLTEPVEVIGRVRARLFVSSDCPDSDVVVKLCDVYPDGRSFLITYGGLRLRFRFGFDREELLQPGEVYEVEVDMWSTAYVFNKGHRIRADVQCSDFPHFDVNPATGEPPGQHTFYQAAVNRFHVSPARPSRLLLPVTSGRVP